MALLKEHYTEVDGLLSGELPSTIAQSFRPPARPSFHGHLSSGMDEDYEENLNHTPTWIRRSSAWKVRKPSNVGEGNENESLLPTSDERDAKRKKLAKLALNSM